MKNFHRLQTSAIQRPHCSITSIRSHKIAKKQKFVYEEDEDQQTLTLRNEFNVKGKSSSSKLLESTQSNSYHRHSKKKVWRREFSSKHVHRNWSYGVNDSSDFKDKFVLVSYNILGVENASKHPDLYPKVPYKYMKWKHRLETICMELAQYDSSILCFQEVDCFSDLSYALQHDGFEGVLKARTGDARDGCAIFWKHDRFKLLHEENIEFRKFGLRDNVAQFCVLEMNDGQLNPDLKMSKSTLVVGNTHILFNPNRGDIKLGQIRLFLEWAHRLSEEWGGIPVVLAGDFNSVPQSAVYQYISSAKLNILLHDRKRVSGQLEIPLCRSSSTKESFRKRPFTYRWNDEELKLATGREMVTYLQHNLKLRSAYHGVPGSNTTRDYVGEPLATSCHSKFMGTVDYIWHNDQLVPVKVLETLSRNTLGKIGGLPNKEDKSEDAGARNRSIKMSLDAKNKQGYIDGSCKKPELGSKDFQRWMRNDYMVRSWIFKSMTERLGESLILCESAKQLWEELVERYDQSNAPQLYQLKKDLSKVQQEGLTVSDYYCKMKRYWDEISYLENYPLCECDA